MLSRVEPDCLTSIHYEYSKTISAPFINTDQGSQFTSEEFTSTVLGNDIKLSMDGKGRAIDNVFIERFWRDIKYEKLYLNPPTDGTDLYLKVAEYMNYYNYQRRHGGIDDLRPSDLYHQLRQAI